MFKNFLLKKMLASQGVPAEQVDMILGVMEKNPELFKKIAEEIQGRVKGGENQTSASMAVMQKYQSELASLMK